MVHICSWLIVGYRLIKYVLYRLGLLKCPNFMEVYYHCMTIVGDMLQWYKKLAVIGPENCPKTGPAIFAGNHAKLDDPFYLFRAIYLASDGNIFPRAMMRDDFFSARAKSRLLDPDEILRLVGAVQFNRENVRVSQLRPFLGLLREGKCFMMYPGRTRSRSGLFMEYREGIDEPGSVAFFLALVGRGQDAVQVPAVPATRTYNPVTRRSTLVFGKPLYADPGAKRAEQRLLDFRLYEAMSDLVEMTVPHLVSALLYVRCLHHLPQTLEVRALEAAVAQVLEAVQHRPIEPEALANLPKAVKKTLKYLRKQGVLQLHQSTIELDTAAILSCPPLDKSYGELNPVKYLTNQILHLLDVMAAVEQAALAMEKSEAASS